MDDSFSAVAESQFSAFFVRRPRPKRRICLFLIFRRGGKPIFAVFLISSTDDEWFSAFSWFHPRMMSVFCCFQCFAYERNAVFSVFCSSLASETLFFAFSAFRLWAKCCFQCFSLVAYKRNAVFGNFCISLTSDEWFSAFLAFQGVGNAACGIFWFSQCWESRFLLFFDFPKFGAVEHHLFFHGTNENVFDFKALGIGYVVFILRSHRYHQSRIR